MKAILGFLAFVVVILFIVVLFVRGGRDEQPTTEAPEPLSAAASTGATFTYVEAGPIVAQEDHGQIVITISQFQRKVEIIQGYENNVVSSSTYTNNEPAFNEFLAALDRAGYTSEQKTDIPSSDGVCPKGRRYNFNSNQFNEDFSRWAASCAERGNFGGQLNTTRQLFRAQIPDLNQMTSAARSQTGINI